MHIITTYFTKVVDPESFELSGFRPALTGIFFFGTVSIINHKVVDPKGPGNDNYLFQKENGKRGGSNGR